MAIDEADYGGGDEERQQAMQALQTMGVRLASSTIHDMHQSDSVCSVSVPADVDQQRQTTRTNEH